LNPKTNKNSRKQGIGKAVLPNINGDNNKQEFNAQTKQLNKLRIKQASTKQENLALKANLQSSTMCTKFSNLI